MKTSEIEAVGAICVLAAMADGTMDERERSQVRAAFEGLGDGEAARALASAYRRAMLGQTSVESESKALSNMDLRRYAFEMAVAVCDADGRHNDPEKRFLECLRSALGLNPAESAEVLAEADALVDLGLPATGQSATGAAAATAAPANPAQNPSEEVDASILRYSILNGALELLPQGLATMAIVPLQMRMVYAVGKSYGVSLDRGHVKELIATVGVGMTSQVVENIARDLLGGLAKRLLGKTAGKVVAASTGVAMSFATTYALGQVAKQYYSGGRKLSAVDLRAVFSREVERAKGLYAQHRPKIEETARTVDPRKILSLVRGA
jgi:uncharacterized protein (DUF697 family)/tellurite resistance protein